MKVLIAYHAGATANAHSIFQELGRLEELELTVMVPETLKVDRIYNPTGWLNAGPEDSSNGYRYVPIALRDPSECNYGFETGPLRRLIRATQPDVIHVLHEANSGYLFQIAWEQLVTWHHAKLLFYGFDNLPVHFPRFYSPLKWRPTWSRLSGGAAANTEVFDHLKRAGFPKNKPLERIFWGIPADVFRPLDRPCIRRELNLEFESIAGFVGRMVPEKGLSVYLDALRALPLSVHGLVIGAGPMHSELVRLSRDGELAGRIQIRDVMDPESLARYINCMDVLAVPSLTTSSWKEQYGRVIGEAMACGVPVVGSDSGAIPEVIDSAGLIVPENDSEQLAEALRTMLFGSSAREQFIERGLNRAENELSSKAMARRLCGFYRRILS